jgi:hypothetical protein
MLHFSKCVVILELRILIPCNIILTMMLPWMMCQRTPVWLDRRILQELSSFFGMLP